jgi:F-type H+-transporting ATPase subunit b
MIEINLTIVIQVLQFLIVVFVLNRLLFRPISQVIDERQEKISTWEENTRRLQDTASLRLENYEKQLREEKIQARQKQEQLSQELKEKEEENLRAVSEKAAQIVTSTQQALAEETERLRLELSHQATELSQILVEKVLGRRLT